MSSFLGVDWETLDLTCETCIVRPTCRRRSCDLLRKAKKDRYFLQNVTDGYHRYLKDTAYFPCLIGR